MVPWDYSHPLVASFFLERSDEMDKALLNFANYVGEFDLNNPKVLNKINHTYRVIELAKEIANKLNLCKEDTEILLKIALLHDIGRFYQIQVNNSFSDFKFDHSDYGIKYLFEKGHIREYNNRQNIDEIIKTSIYYHNKHSDDIPSLDDYTKMFVYLIRDIDKIDIYYMASLISPFVFQKDKLLPNYLDDFMNQKLVRRLPQETKSDNFLVLCGFIYDFNYLESYELLKEKGYLDRLFDNVEVDENSIDFFNELKNIVYSRLDNKVRKRVRC